MSERLFAVLGAFVIGALFANFATVKALKASLYASPELRIVVRRWLDELDTHRCSGPPQVRDALRDRIEEAEARQKAPGDPPKSDGPQV